MTVGGDDWRRVHFANARIYEQNTGVEDIALPNSAVAYLHNVEDTHMHPAWNR